MRPVNVTPIQVYEENDGALKSHNLANRVAVLFYYECG